MCVRARCLVARQLIADARSLLIQVKVESNPKKAREKLLEVIAPEVLPAFLGGEYTGEWIMR